MECVSFPRQALAAVDYERCAQARDEGSDTSEPSQVACAHSGTRGLPVSLLSMLWVWAAEVGLDVRQEQGSPAVTEALPAEALVDGLGGWGREGGERRSAESQETETQRFAAAADGKTLKRELRARAERTDRGWRA